MPSQFSTSKPSTPLWWQAARPKAKNVLELSATRLSVESEHVTFWMGPKRLCAYLHDCPKCMYCIYVSTVYSNVSSSLVCLRETFAFQVPWNRAYSVFTHTALKLYIPCICLCKNDLVQKRNTKFEQVYINFPHLMALCIRLYQKEPIWKPQRGSSLLGHLLRSTRWSDLHYYKETGERFFSDIGSAGIYYC